MDDRDNMQESSHSYYECTRLPIDLRSYVLLHRLSSIMSTVLPKWLVTDANRPGATLNTHLLSESVPENLKGIISEVIYTGSRAQGLAVPIQYAKKLLIFSKGDRDMMLVLCTCRIGARSGSAGQYHMHIDTTNTMPGYIRLIHRRVLCDCAIDYGTLATDENNEMHCYIVIKSLVDSFKSQLNRFVETLKINNTSGELRAKDKREDVVTAAGPAVNLNFDNSLLSTDFAFAVKCPIWPDVAIEWCLRRRPSGWPDPETLVTAINSGCHVVPIANRLSSWPLVEWRFSFTVAETQLARTLSDSQRHCYVLFKVLVQHAVRPHQGLSTYCLKNIMYWAMEKIPVYYWSDENHPGLARCFLYLIDQVLHCLSEHDLPHYFMQFAD